MDMSGGMGVSVLLAVWRRHVDEVHADGAEGPLLGGDAGDVKYPCHLVNGRVPADPQVFRGKPGKRVRIRLIKRRR
jgi:hypothetical protein